MEGKGAEVEAQRGKTGKDEEEEEGIEMNREDVTTTERKALHDGGGDPCLSIFDYL